LNQRWKERQKETNLQQITIAAFATPHKLDNLSPSDRFGHMQEKLQDLISCLPESQSQKFDSLSGTPGYLSWNQFFLHRETLPINLVWKQWISQLNSDDSANFENFIDLFQNAQICSMSEAICETVGSMMVTHGGKGRYLQPVNFSVEMYLRFNLGPLHLLNGLCKKIVRDRQKECIRKSEKSKRLDRLISRNSAAVANFRKKQEEKGKLPSEIWKDIN
jgi:hypothetical protein